MIDDLKEAMGLVEKMKVQLPISVYPTTKLCNIMKNNSGIKLKLKNVLEITDVLYMNDEGGIGCTIAFNASDELLVVSLIHLRIKEMQPLTKEIKTYQIKRKMALAKKLIGK